MFFRSRLAGTRLSLHVPAILGRSAVLRHFAHLRRFTAIRHLFASPCRFALVLRCVVFLAFPDIIQRKLASFLYRGGVTYRRSWPATTSSSASAGTAAAPRSGIPGGTVQRLRLGRLRCFFGSHLRPNCLGVRQKQLDFARPRLPKHRLRASKPEIGSPQMCPVSQYASVCG